MLLSLNGEYILNHVSDFPPIIKEREKETYPVFMDPENGDMYICIAWAGNVVTGYEYYAFGKAKGSYKSKKNLVYSGLKMEQSTSFGTFERSMFINNDDFEFCEDPDELGRFSNVPAYRTLGSENSVDWKRVDVPFF